MFPRSRGNISFLRNRKEARKKESCIHVADYCYVIFGLLTNKVDFLNPLNHIGACGYRFWL
jgi:hypothetical protein